LPSVGQHDRTGPAGLQAWAQPAAPGPHPSSPRSHNRGDRPAPQNKSAPAGLCPCPLTVILAVVSHLACVPVLLYLHRGLKEWVHGRAATALGDLKLHWGPGVDTHKPKRLKWMESEERRRRCTTNPGPRPHPSPARGPTSAPPPRASGAIAANAAKSATAVTYYLILVRA
jgi:hypothetical protein